MAARADKAMVQGFDKKLVSTSGYYRTGRFLAAKQDMSKEGVPAERFLRETIPYVNTPHTGTETKMRVGYFVGCTTNFLFPDMGKMIIDLLVRNGVEVVVPREQGCCGSPALLRVGDFDTARERADLNVKIFEELDYIVTGCPTCAATMRKYAHFLADTPERRKAYGELSGKIFEIVGFLADILRLPASAYQIASEAKGKKITWHDPCHLSRHLGVRSQPRRILRGLRDIDYVEMARADWCCGNAGVFSETHFEYSSKIADKKAQAIEASGADIVVTSCPGCILQLENTIRKNEMDQKVMHIVELIG
jgi:glycolate oxidase iron-sulfur subunit